MNRRLGRVCVVQPILGLHDFLQRSMEDQEELAGLDVLLVFEDAVLRNSNTDQCGAEGAEPAYHGGAFKHADDPCHERSRHDERADARHDKDAEPKSIPHRPPQNAPIFPQYIIRSPAL